MDTSAHGDQSDQDANSLWRMDTSAHGDQSDQDGEWTNLLTGDQSDQDATHSGWTHLLMRSE